MTTTNKDITNFLEEQGIGYNPIRMLNLLGKLDHEDLEDLLNAMLDLYKAGEEEAGEEEAGEEEAGEDSYHGSDYKRSYDNGFIAGRDSVLKKYGSD